LRQASWIINQSRRYLASSEVIVDLKKNELRKDILVLVGRLYGESPITFSPERRAYVAQITK